MEAPENVHKERRTMFMVSIPGLNEWASNVEKQQNVIQMSDIEMETDGVSQGVKRSLETDKVADEEMNGSSLQKKICTKANGEGTTQGLSPEYLLNSPIADRPSKACMIKFYDDFSDFTLNSVLDVVGFVSMDPALCGSLHEPDEYENAGEVCAKNPPPSLIPRIHAVAHRSVANLNPLFDQSISLTDQNRIDICKDLRLVLTQCLFEDRVAADYLLCHLISTVYIRMEETLGQFSINLTNFPASTLPDYTSNLYGIIEMLLPASHYFPITLENLNTTEFVPK